MGVEPRLTVRSSVLVAGERLSSSESRELFLEAGLRPRPSPPPIGSSAKRNITSNWLLPQICGQ